MRLENVLDGIHASMTHRWYLQLFTAFTRILLAIGFTPPSIIKIINRPFTLLPDSEPVGHYFNALYQTGFYYQFIGWSQLIAAILLLFPRTAHWGALMFLPIIVNITVLTNSVGFQGTWFITILMSFAAFWLVAWDYDRLKPLLFATRVQPSQKLKKQAILVPIAFAVGGAVMAAIMVLVGLAGLRDYLLSAGVLSLAGLVFGIVVAIHFRYMKVGELKNADDRDIL